MGALSVLATGYRFLDLQAATWGAIAAWATFAILGLTALFARRQVKESARLRELETRPWVVVYFDVTLERQFIHVVLENTGRTVATDVKVAFTPLLASSIDGGKQVEFFRETFPTLPPGSRIDSLLDSAVSRFQSDLPKRYTVTVTYGGLVTDEPYENEFLLDLAAFENIRHINRKGMHKLAEAVESIDRTLSGFGHAGRLQVETVTAAEVTDAIEEQLAEIRQLQQQAREEAEPPPTDAE